MSNDVWPRWPLRERDWVTVAVVGGLLFLVLLAAAVWLHARHVAEREAKARAAAAAQAALPKRLAPITTSVYVRTVPVRHTQ